MKKLICLGIVGGLLAAGASQPSFAESSFEFRSSAVKTSSEVITLGDVVKKVSSANYLVLENAQKVYQAKEAIAVARGNLLPKLNLWKIITMPLTLLGALAGAEDVAPFLVPANWMRVEEQKLLYLAQNESYRALWANEVMTAKTLYVHLMVDLSLYDHVEKNEEELARILDIVRARERFGTAKPGGSRNIEVRLLALKEDKRALAVLIAEESSLLSYIMGFKSDVELVLTPLELPDFETLEPLEYADFEFRALDTSPEIRQLGHVIKAADYVKREVTFSFLGVSTMSRGVAGGVFDNLPITSGLGFGTGGSMKIVKAQKEILKIQSRGVEETLKRRLKLLVDIYNLDLENYRNLKRRAELTQSIVDQLYDRLRFGDPVEADELVKASENHIDADTAFSGVKFRIITNEDKLARMIFFGDYSKEPAALEVAKKKDK